jgi:serine/threonine-protein kinase
MIGDKLGPWTIDRELGRGGMGRVYLAHSEPADRQAAVKVLAAELAQDSGFLHRFEREIEALSQLSHPNIVQFLEAGYEDGKYFYAMEYVQGQSFEELLQERGRLPWQEALDAALQICPALKHAHDRGVIHRDLKPPNLMRTADGTVKLMDFGIAKVFASTHLTATGGVVGTAEYLSPEQAAGKPVTRRSDLYSLGVVLYTLITGRTPFAGETFLDLLHKHRFGQFDRPQKLVPQIPYELDEVICNLLEKDPAKRPADGLVLQRLLEAIKRKLARKAHVTSPGVRQDQTVAGTHDYRERAEENVEGPATLMSRLMRQELDQQNRGGPVRQLFNRPIVLVPLFLLCVGIIVWTFWPRGESDADEPAKTKPVPSEARRIYRQGERLNREGDLGGAQRAWEDVVLLFQDVDGEHAWVRLAEKRLEELSDEASDKRWNAVRSALKRARQLRDEARALADQKKPFAAQEKLDQARAIWDAIERRYGNDPSATKIIQEMKKDREK